MVLLFEVLPHFPPNLNMPTYYAVMRLILGVADDRTALKSFLSHIGVCVREREREERKRERESVCVCVHVCTIHVCVCTHVHCIM